MKKDQPFGDDRFTPGNMLRHFTDNNNTIGGRKFTGGSDLRLAPTPNDGVMREKTFDHCYFDSTTNFEVEGYYKIKFTNCYFSTLNFRFHTVTHLYFINTSVENLNISTTDTNGQQLILNIEKLADEQEITKIGPISIGRCFSTISAKGVSMERIEIAESLQSSSLTLDKCIVECTNDDAVNIHGKPEIPGTGYALTIINQSSLNGGILCKNQHGLTLNVDDSFLKKAVSLDQVSSSVNNLSNSEINSFSYTKIANLLFSLEGKSVNDIIVTNAQISRFEINKSLFERFKINKIQIKNSNLTKDANFLIDAAEIGEFIVTHFSNDGNIRLQNSKIKATVIIGNARMGKTEWQNVDLLDNVRFTLLNSTLNEAKFFSVDWMKDHKLVEENFNKGKGKDQEIEYYLSLKESYRQMKAISLVALNKFDALNFQRHEQRAQKEILWLKGDRTDHFLLWTNQIFNNYGLSYLKPLAFLIVFHIAWFSILLFNNKLNYYFTFTESNLESFWIALSEFTYTIFPLHYTTYLGKDPIGWPLLVDILMRVSSGYFIYYFLSATRKFHVS